jgi:hypothetical protein
LQTKLDAGPGALDPELRRKLSELQEEGFDIWQRFDIEVRQKDWHPFVPVDYEVILQKLLPLRGDNLKFLEWGSATGVIAIMADLIGFEAYGIELDGKLVETARELAAKYGSRATFVEGTFLPTGYEYRSPDGDKRLGTLGGGESGYLALKMPLEEFDIVYGYPWDGEAVVMRDVMKRYGRADAIFLLQGQD